MEYTILYTPVLNVDGTKKEPPENFSTAIGITSLEEYYNWLPEIKSKSIIDEDGKTVLVPTKYTILPLDEPHFEINANTRAINIPNEFKKNGIAVQGDDLAEVVYFKVDRYFDAMDLNNTDIYIEWETPKDKTHDAIKSVSDITIRDIESEPGKLIFGWAISDAITAAAGNLKFSVKFLQWDKDESTGKRNMVYALNTLTATIAIHQSIGLDVNTDYNNIDNANNRLLERIEPGVVVGGVQAEIPYFLENIDPNKEYDIVPYKDGSYKIYAVATSADTGSITYMWRRRDLDINNIPSADELEVPNSSSTEMVPVKIDDKGYPIFVERHAYYYGDNYTPFSGTIEDVKTKWPLTNEGVNPCPIFYEKKAVLTVTDCGVYTVEARNRIFNSMSKKKSDSATFKRPDLIQINIDDSNENQRPNAHIIGETSAKLTPIVAEAVGDIAYQWYKAPEVATVREHHAVMDLPLNTKISYGEDTIRVAFAEDTKWYVNKPEQNATQYRYEIRSYVPYNAVKYIWTAVRGSHVENIVSSNVKWDADPEINPTNMGSDKRGAYVISNVVAAIKNGDAWLSLDKYQSDLAYGLKGSTIMIEWYDDKDRLLNKEILNVEVTSEDKYVPINNYVEISGAINSELEPTEEGLYMAHIVRTRNNRTAEIDTVEYRVTEATAKPEFTGDIYVGNVIIDIDELNIGERVPYVEMSPDVKFDEYEVKWYLFKEGEEPDLLLATNYISNRISKFNPLEYASTIEAKGEENIEGRYYAVVRNKRNGVFSESTDIPTEDKMFVIVD